MTERGRRAVFRERTDFQLGPSALSWSGSELVISFDERSFPIPGRIKGKVRLTPYAMSTREFALDGEQRHRWWPLAPRSRIEVQLEEPGLSWSGDGYWDENFGDEALENAFENWNWSRATVGDEAAILYDITRRGGSRAAMALRIDAHGDVGAMELPELVPLPSTGIWRVPRHTQADLGQGRIIRTLEDTPFYSRSEIATRLLGQETIAMHESLALGRLRSPVVKSLLPWRMPRNVWSGLPARKA